MPPYDVTYTGTSEYHWPVVGGLANGGYGNRGFVDENGTSVNAFKETSGPFGFEEAMQHDPNTVYFTLPPLKPFNTMTCSKMYTQ